MTCEILRTYSKKKISLALPSTLYLAVAISASVMSEIMITLNYRDNFYFLLPIMVINAACCEDRLYFYKPFSAVLVVRLPFLQDKPQFCRTVLYLIIVVLV